MPGAFAWSRARLGQPLGCCVRRHAPERGLVRTDPVLLQRMQPAGRLAYRRCLGDFLAYVRWLQLNPSESFELDDLMLEWRHGTDMPPFMKPPTQSIFATTLSALEKALPHVKGDFCTAHAALDNWRVAFRATHSLALLPRWQRVMVLGMLRTGKI